MQAQPFPHRQPCRGDEFGGDWERTVHSFKAVVQTIDDHAALDDLCVHPGGDPNRERARTMVCFAFVQCPGVCPFPRNLLRRPCESLVGRRLSSTVETGILEGVHDRHLGKSSAWLYLAERGKGTAGLIRVATPQALSSRLQVIERRK